MKNIILLSGKAHSGKNYCADYLEEQLKAKGYRVVQDMFAKYIKGYLKDYYGWDGITKDDFYRDKMQQLGTDIIKEKLNYKSFHALRLAQDISIIENDFDYIIISDCRFRDEIYAMKAMFPDKVIDIRVDRIDKDVRDDLGELANHKSEIDLDDFKFTYYIDNDGTDNVKSWLDSLINVLVRQSNGTEV